jgi:hypothetical protein
MTSLAHTHDPDTSHEAVARLDKKQLAVMKRAILSILAAEPRTAFSTTRAYFDVREFYDYPYAKRDSIAKRMSELHKEGLIRDTGRRAPTGYGRPAVVWEVVK